MPSKSSAVYHRPTLPRPWRTRRASTSHPCLCGQQGGQCRAHARAARWRGLHLPRHQHQKRRHQQQQQQCRRAQHCARSTGCPVRFRRRPPRLGFVRRARQELQVCDVFVPAHPVLVVHLKPDQSHEGHSKARCDNEAVHLDLLLVHWRDRHAHSRVAISIGPLLKRLGVRPVRLGGPHGERRVDALTHSVDVCHDLASRLVAEGKVRGAQVQERRGLRATPQRQRRLLLAPRRKRAGSGPVIAAKVGEGGLLGRRRRRGSRLGDTHQRAQHRGAHSRPCGLARRLAALGLDHLLQCL